MLLLPPPWFGPRGFSSKNFLQGYACYDTTVDVTAQAVEIPTPDRGQTKSIGQVHCSWVEPEENCPVVAGIIILRKAPVGDASDNILGCARYVLIRFFISGVTKIGYANIALLYEYLLISVLNLLIVLCF